MREGDDAQTYSCPRLHRLLHLVTHHIYDIYCYICSKLLPNDRVPGFMFHQTERHFNNGTGDDSAGR